MRSDLIDFNEKVDFEIANEVIEVIEVIEVLSIINTVLFHFDMIKLVLISALVAVALAQFPKPCTVPLQFEARVSEFNHATSQETRYHLSYDAINKRVRFVEEVHARTPGRKFYEVGQNET